MATTLRQRIRVDKISCQPWKRYRGEIKRLPISSQCLFANCGIPWDIFEISLKEEGWLLENESLWDVLSMDSGLKRRLDHSVSDDEPFDDTWTDDDYEYFYNNL